MAEVMTPEQSAAIAARNEARNQIINKLSYDLWEVYTDNDPEAGTKNNRVWDLLLAFHDKIANNQAAEVARLTAVIEHDRSKVVDVLAEANAVLKNYGWLAEGRGSYAFDDDRWKDEFKVCMDSLAKVLDPMRGIASDLSDSPIKWADIVAARSMTDALAEAEKREGHGIYVASKTVHAQMWKRYRNLGAPIISTWLDEAGVGETADFPDLWQRCISEAASCEALIAYREPGEVLKGAFIEIGAALANGRKVYCVGDFEGMSFTNHPLVAQVPDVAAAIRAMVKP